MRTIIEEIWRDAETFGWNAIKGRKDYYIKKSYNMDLSSSQLEAMDVTYDLVGYGKEYKASFECKDCHKIFDSRDSLYKHYTEDHEGNKPL